MQVISNGRAIAAWSIWALLALVPVVNAQTTSEGNSKAVNRNAKGPAVAERAPGNWVQRGIQGPQITQTREQAETPTRLQEVYIDTLNTLFVGLNTVIPLIPELFGGEGGGGTIGVNAVIITEVSNNGNNSFVELYNNSGLRLDLDGWAMCNTDVCTHEGEFVGRRMEPDEILVLQLGGESDANVLPNGVLTIRVATTLDELALYDFSDSDQRDPRESLALIDYVRWGDDLTPGETTLSTVAVSKGIWDANSLISERLTNRSFQIDPDRLSNARSDHYIVTNFIADALGELDPLQPSTESTETTE